MIIYECYSDSISVQFLDENTAKKFAMENNLDFRVLELDDDDLHKDVFDVKDFYSFENFLRNSESIYNKFLESTGNGLLILLNSIDLGKRGYDVDKDLQIAFNMLSKSMKNSLTQNEVYELNEELKKLGVEARFKLS